MFTRAARFCKGLFASREQPKKVPAAAKNVLATEAMTYEECEAFLPLHENDVVYVIRCYDGDTATLSWCDPSSGKKVRKPCRLRGYDSAEIRTKSPREKELALHAKKRLEDAIKGEFVTILAPGQDKFGRILCDLQTDNIVSVSDHMLAGGLDVAKPYSGGKKEGWVLSPSSVSEV